MKRILTAILLSIIIHLPAVGKNNPDLKLITPHFIIYYNVSQSRIAERAGEIAETNYQILSAKLKIKKAGRTPIYLYPNRQVFRDATGIDLRSAVVGLAHTRSLSIKIDASGAYQDISRVIPHEIVHILTSQKLRGNSANLPLWAHEGIAKYLSDDWTNADTEILADIAPSNRFYPLKKLTNVFPNDGKKMSIAYVQSYTIIKYMAEIYTSDSLNDLLDEIAKGRKFPDALKYSIGITPEQFEQDWHTYMMKKYRIGRWTNLFTGLISASMVIGILLAYRAYRIHKRRVIANMEAESDDEG